MNGRRRIIFGAKPKTRPEPTVLRPESLAVDATFVAHKDPCLTLEVSAASSKKTDCDN